ncbi:MAG: peptidylprolyl isomerase [Planctomycetes bacterium]|nr:peptidylprolyl isomerase [Planctomycetota bacterium]
MRSAIPLSALIACWIAACGAPDVPVDPPGARNLPSAAASGADGAYLEGTRREAGNPPSTLAEVAGENVTADELSSFLLRRDPRLFEQIVDELLLRRVVEIEARTQGVSCEGKELERRVQRAVDDEVAGGREFLWRQYRVSLENYLASTRSDLAAYRAGLGERLRRDTVSKILFERLVRYWSLTTEWIDIRRIVVKDPGLAGEIREKILLGASPSVLAKTYCVCPCREDGGKLPRIYRETADPAIADTLFAMQERGISEVLEMEEGYAVYVVLALQRRREVPYSAAEREVLASLEEHGPDSEETRDWYQSAVRRLGGIRFPFRPVPSDRTPARE